MTQNPTIEIVQQMRECLEAIIEAYPSPVMSHVEFRVFAVREAETALSNADKLLAGIEAMGWQPIATAPRDGAPVFLLFPKWDYSPVASWEIMEGGDEDGEGMTCAWCFQDDVFGTHGDGWVYGDCPQPIAWMPTPPKDKDPS